MAKAKAKKNRKKRLMVIAALIAAVFMTPLAAGAVSTVFPALAGRTAEPEQDKQQKPAEMAENIDNTDETPADDGKKDEDMSSENGYAAVQLLSNDLLRPNTLKALIEELEYIPFDTGDGTVYVPVRKNENGYPVCTLQESTDSAGETVTWSVNIDENTDYKELLSDIDSDKYYQDEKNRLYLLPKQGLYVDFPEPGAIPLVELNGDTSAPALPKEGDNHTDMGLFEDFWQMYPRKLSKAKTERVWKKLAPDDELQKQIIETVKSAVTSAEWERENGMYIPAPYRWLENQGWENTYTQVKAKGYDLDEVEEMSFFHLPENF